MISLIVPAVGGHVKLLEQTLRAYATGTVIPADIVVVTDTPNQSVVLDILARVVHPYGITTVLIPLDSDDAFVDGLKIRTADRGYLRSEGLRLATHPYVALGEADCVPGPDCLRAHLAIHLASTEPIYTCCGALARLTPTLSRTWQPLSETERFNGCVDHCRTLKDNQRAYFREKDGWRGALTIMPTKYARYAMGYQPNRKGFGAEELKFFDRIEYLGLKEIRVPSPMLHQWHPREFTFEELNANHYDMKFFNKKYKDLIKRRLDDVLSLDWTKIPMISDFDTDEEAWKWLENALLSNSVAG